MLQSAGGRKTRSALRRRGWIGVSALVAALIVLGMAALRLEAAPMGRLVRVTNGPELRAAMAAAQPGDRIQLADGVYAGTFAATTSGTARAPITVEGGAGAVIDGGSLKRGYGFHLRADRWVLRGFRITNAKKGLIADGAQHNLIDGLDVSHIGEEAIHLRAFSSDNIVQGCTIRDTGVLRPDFGEGIYLGSAKSNWKTYAGGQPDRSDRNRVLRNRFGPDVRAEAIDVKEGTTGGELRGNSFDGAGMRGKNAADSWVDLKGNGYTVAENVGRNTLRDGFQTHIALPGWGRDNLFRANRAAVGAGGYAIRIQLDRKDAAGNVVYADNRVSGTGALLANVPLRP